MSADVMPVIDALTQNGCRFVVVGSVAVQLLDGSGEPRDLDIVAPDTAADRRRLVEALAAVGGWIQTTGGPRPVATLAALPSWSWRVKTAYDVTLGRPLATLLHEWVDLGSRDDLDERLDIIANAISE